MTKIDLILENIKDEYMINLLEEGETTELETLKTKKFLNENINRIRKMLIEEGLVQTVQESIQESWGLYLSEAAHAGDEKYEKGFTKESKPRAFKSASK